MSVLLLYFWGSQRDTHLPVSYEQLGCSVETTLDTFELL